MADTLPQIADQMGVSSLHVTFNTQREWEEMGAGHGFLQRAGIQVGRREGQRHAVRFCVHVCTYLPVCHEAGGPRMWHAGLSG